MFNGRNLIIATKHQKEKVIAPILENQLGVKCLVDSNLDTDTLGTFTGEVDRKDDPITTARKKCEIAMRLTNCDLAVASEGSFGAHPSIYFVPADDEFMLFIDKKNNLEIVARELSSETNFNAAEIKNDSELYVFANNAKFPTHGLILRRTKHDYTEIVKGITSFEKLNKVFKHFTSRYGTAYIETDMRAMYNPTRMNVIEKATIKLAEKINSRCPQCNTPGFGITNAIKGLPCQLCNLPTRSTLSYIYSCEKCLYSKKEKYPNDKHFEDAMYCDVCNP